MKNQHSLVKIASNGLEMALETSKININHTIWLEILVRIQP